MGFHCGVLPWTLRLPNVLHMAALWTEMWIVPLQFLPLHSALSHLAWASTSVERSHSTKSSLFMDSLTVHWSYYSASATCNSANFDYRPSETPFCCKACLTSADKNSQRLIFRVALNHTSILFPLIQLQLTFSDIRNLVLSLLIPPSHVTLYVRLFGI